MIVMEFLWLWIVIGALCVGLVLCVGMILHLNKRVKYLELLQTLRPLSYYIPTNLFNPEVKKLND